MPQTYLNISHQLPRIGIDSTPGRISKAVPNQPQIHGNGNQQARSEKGFTQSSIDINSYPSRRAYGHRNMTDYTAERGQQGIADVQRGTSDHARETWALIERGPRRGNYWAGKYKNEMYSQHQQRNRIDLTWIPDPQITFHPSELTGDIDTGDVTERIETQPSPNIQYTPGSIRTYLEDQGFINRWTSIGEYDIRI